MKTPQMSRRFSAIPRSRNSPIFPIILPGMQRIVLILLLGIGLVCLVYITSKRSLRVEKCDILTNTTCIMMSADDLIQYGREHKYPNGIPRIIHYMENTQHIPTQYSHHARQCMLINKDAKFVFWTHKSAEKLIKKHFPAYAAKYQSYVENKVDALLVSDVNRYFILYLFGGIYMDFDTRCQKPLGLAMESRPCILSTQLKVDSRIHSNYEVVVMNSLMACVPNHTFFKILVDKLIPAGELPGFGQTGPTFLTFEYLAYNRTSFNAKEPTKSVFLSEEQEFSPITVVDLERLCKRKLTEKWQIQGCKELTEFRKQERQKEKQGVVAHLYLHLGYNWMANAIKVRDNICTISDNVHFVC